MNSDQWDRLAKRFDKEVFNPFLKDRNHRRLCEVASPRKSVADFGCGTGRMLPFLSKRFGQVYGCDWSAKCIQVASRRCRHAANVRVSVEDVSRASAEIPPVDVAVSVNALIDLQTL